MMTETTLTPGMVLAKENVARARADYVKAADKRQGDTVALFNRYSSMLHAYRLARRAAKETENG